MKADWDDAPARVRGKSDKLFLKLLFTVAGLVFLGAWIPLQMSNTVEEIETSRKYKSTSEPSKQAADKQKPAPAESDPYLEQVNRMLGITNDYVSKPNAELEWSAADPVQPIEKQQNVFTDSNYTPPATVNTIRMPQPQPQPVQSQQRKQSYVTVVKETKLSCWPFKEGSTECRRHKAKMHQIWRRNCDTGTNSQSHSCRQANRYDLR